MPVQLIIMILIALALILVTVQNPNPVSLQFLSWEARQMPLIIIILISLLVGIIIASVLSLIKQSKLKEKIRFLEREMESLKHHPPDSQDDDLED